MQVPSHRGGVTRFYARLLAEDVMKLQFMLDALDKPDPFAQKKPIPLDVDEAMNWLAGKTPQEVGVRRLALVSFSSSACLCR